MTFSKSIFSFLFVALLWLRIAMLFAHLTHDAAIALFLSGSVALLIFQVLCDLLHSLREGCR